MNSLRIEIECAAQLLIILVTISLSSDLQDSGVTSGFKDAAHVFLSGIVRDPSPSSGERQISQDLFDGEFSSIKRLIRSLTCLAIACSDGLKWIIRRFFLGPEFENLFWLCE